MGLEDVPRCQHVKVNGTQCGSPALRRRRRCYFHEEVRVERAKVKADQFSQRGFEMPLLEDANAVQLALMKVLQMLARGQMELKMAGLMLYGLQTASANLKNTKFEAEKVTDVVIDRNTVEQTCINGPQWFAKDFAEQGEPELLEEEEMDQLAEEKGEEVVAEISQGEIFQAPLAQQKMIEGEVSPAPVRVEVCEEKMGPPGKACAVKRKRPALKDLDDEPDSLAKILLQRLGLPLTNESAASG
ncbi:MAG: hypothetical protein WBV69_08800 [Candidatus Sulfotelmatobacter sp.]